MKLLRTILASTAFAILSLPVASFAKGIDVTITDYTGLVNFLQQGRTVNVIIDVNKCKFLDGKTNDWNETQRGFRFTRMYERITTDLTSGKKMHVVATVEHDYNGNAEPNSLYINRSLLRVFENNSVELIDMQFDPISGSRKGFTAMVCQLTNDNSGGVKLLSHN